MHSGWHAGESPKLSKRGMVEPLDLTALFRAGMALMAALNLVLALVIFRRHCGTPAHEVQCHQCQGANSNEGIWKAQLAWAVCDWAAANAMV